MSQVIFSVIRTSLQVVALITIFNLSAATQDSVAGQKKRKVNALPSATPKAPLSVSDRFEKEGVRIDFSLKAAGASGNGIVAGTDATISFSVRDARTGQPLTGVRPSAWISSRKLEHAPSQEDCQDKIRTFVGGLSTARPDIDLNGYLLLTLNHDNTMSVINPFASFSQTKLENLITLPGAGADWTLAKDKETVYITMPEQSSVAVVSTITRKIVRVIPVGQKTRPMRAELQPDARYLWVALDGSPLVAVIDTKTDKLAATIEAGGGSHSIAFTPESNFAYVTNSTADTISVMDAKKLVKITDLPVAKTPGPVAYGGASRLIYAAAINGTSVSVIDPARQKVVRSIPVKRGVVAMRFDPSGRFGFVVNQAESLVEIFDASTGQVAGTVAVVEGPDQVMFTDLYAYVRGTGSEKFSLIELAGILKGMFTAINVVAGQMPPNALPGEIGVANMIAMTPEGNSVMIANTPDQMIYYYVEGMMAPMGTFSNYKRRPHAVLILDRSLREIAPGVYSAPVRLKSAGRFDVSVLTDQPRIAHCFQLEVAE